MKFIKTNKKLLNWKNFSFNFKINQLLTLDNLTNAVNFFFENEVNKIKDNQHIIIAFRIVTVDHVHKTLGELLAINKTDKDFYLDYINNKLLEKTDGYGDVEIYKVVFSYGVRDGLAPKKAILLPEKDLNTVSYYNHKLPITLNPYDYGKYLGTLIDKDQNNVMEFQNKYGNLYKIIHSVDSNGLITNKITLHRLGITELKFIDSQIDDTSFKRIIKNRIYICNFITNKEEINFTEKTTNFYKKLLVDKKYTKKFLTLDIETLLGLDIHNNNLMLPYLVSIYDGNRASSFYLSDYKNDKELIQEALKSIITLENNKKNVYIHNMGNFDSVFILPYLIELGTLTPLFNKGRLISFSFSTMIDNKPVTINFLDSYQILLGSLRKLAESFNVRTQKDIFPFEFVTGDNLDYIGPVPSIDKFPDLSIEEYVSYLQRFPNNDWNLRKEAIKYCEIDCISLYEVLDSFGRQIFNRWKIDFTKYPTITSLSFAIYRTHYMKIENIPVLERTLFKRIKTSYTGGATDMYIPSNLISLTPNNVLLNDNILVKNEQLYYYDVNSLYPSIMCNIELPIGKPIIFEGDALKHLPDKLGFYYCKVTAPLDLKHPILQKHVKINGTISTIGALGEFFMNVYSEELKNALRYGYKFEIISGVVFSERGNIFKDFVTDMYNLRLSYDKTDPMNFIAKILMNSLYGRFGLDDNFNTMEIMNKIDFNKFLETFNGHSLDNVSDIMNIGDEHAMVSFKQDQTDAMLDSKNYRSHTNVAIASAITAMARVHMTNYKNNGDIVLYYTDTDSIVTNLSPNEIDQIIPNIVGNNLGQLKLECVVNKAVFLGPKAYALETDKGKLIIKIKGLSSKIANSLSIESFYNLLFKDSSLDINQNKWFKNREEANIRILDHSYKIQHNSNKRILLYHNDILVNTKPYVLEIEEIIIRRRKTVDKIFIEKVKE